MLVKKLKKTIFLLFLLLYAACAQPDLNGHWHITAIKEKEKIMGSKYLTLDIYDDTLGIIKEQVFLNSGFTGLVNSKKQEMLFGGECLVLNFEFTYEEGVLYLRQLAYTEPEEKQFIAKRCDETCCDRQQDYFSSTMLDIDLPQKIDSIRLIEAEKHPSSLSYPLFFGVANNLKNVQDKSRKFTIGLKDFEGNIDSIARYDEQFLIKIPEEYWKRVRRVIYADKNTPLKNMIPVLKKYRELGIVKMLVALKEIDSAQNLKIWHHPIETLNLIEDANPLTTWEDFLKNR